MARRRTLTSIATASSLALLAIAVGLPVNVVSDYVPDAIKANKLAWIGGLVVLGLLTVVLTWLAPRLAEHRFRGVLFQVPPLSQDWVYRTELDDVVAALVGKGAGTVGVTTALVGAGGFGKTSLAVAACHHERVRRHFSGGIVWVTVGQDKTSADVIALIGDISAAVDGEHPHVSDPGLISHHLAQALAGRGRMLLVVDDVWNANQLKPFLPAAERSRLLVTTRRPRTLPGGSIKVSVDEMTPQAATEVISATFK